MNTFLLLQAIRNRLMPELENLPLLTRTRDRRDRAVPQDAARRRIHRQEAPHATGRRL